MGLLHLGVDVETRVAKIRDSLCQQLHAVDAVAENDRLVDLQTRKQRVQAMHFLAFLHIGVKLRNTSQSQLVHQIDLVRLLLVCIPKALDRYGERCREQADLAILWQVLGDDLFDDRSKLCRQQLVSFIHDHQLHLVQLTDPFVCQVQNTTRSSNQNVHRLVHSHNIILQTRSSRGHHDLQSLNSLSEILAHLRVLQSKLTGRYQDQRLDHVLLGVHLFQGRDQKRCGLSGSVLSTGKDVTACKRDGNCLFLNGTWLLESHLENSHQQLSSQVIILKVISLGCSHVLRFLAIVLFRQVQLVLPVGIVRINMRKGVIFQRRVMSGNRG
mmetsp:Transcript_1843/g.3218  ORF Transcript_1843/g.3218 Transcript_1843/m.3218 type:complete len:327 (-) Transcript_1843:1338-2318(-)